MPTQFTPYSPEFLKALQARDDDDEESTGPSALDGKQTVGDLEDSLGDDYAGGAQALGPAAAQAPAAQVAVRKGIKPSDRLVSSQAAPLPTMGGTATYAGKPEDDDSDDSDNSTAGSDSLGAQPSYKDYMVSPEELADTAKQKRWMALLGAVGQNLSNRQSAGNFMLGKMNPEQDFSGFTKSMQDAIQSPIDQKKTMLAQTENQPKYEQLYQAMRPDSDISNMIRETTKAKFAMLRDSGIAGNMDVDALSSKLDGMNGFQIQRFAEQAGLDKLIGNGAMIAKLNKTLGNRNNLQAQATVNHDPELTKYIPRLDGAQKIMNLIDAGERGEFKTNKALLGQLNAEISRLETGSQSPGLAAGEKTEMNSLAANLKDIVDTASGGVSSVDLAPKFAQARGMVGDLGKSYYNQIGNRIDFLKSGSGDDQHPIYDAKADQFRKMYSSFAPSQNEEQSPPGSSDGNSGQAGGKVTVISPEGKRGMIPAANLAKALARGFKRVE